MDFITIDNFEGPLDLLLHLVKESNIDILDIKIEDITIKYLDYINKCEDVNINVSSEYLVMAAELIYLKSKLLLPNNKEEIEESNDEITRDNLINRLVEYEKYKNITPSFKLLEEERKKIYVKGPEKISNYKIFKNEESVDNLVLAFKKLLDRKELDKPLDTVITNKEYSIKKRKNRIIDILKSKKKIYFDEIMEENNKPYIVVTFISMLELVKEGNVLIKQNNNFDKILIELRD